MPDSTFNNNSDYKSRSILSTSQTPGMAKFLINKGIVKNEKQARGILLTITTISLLASIYIFATFVFDIQIFNRTPQLTEEQIQQNRERLERLRQERRNTTNTTTNTQ